MRDDPPAGNPSNRRSSVCTGVARIALAIATVAMATLHVLQPILHPVDRPVSFYIHGEHGWLLPLALGAFGIAALALSLAPRVTLSRGASRSLALSGIGILVTALVPSDRWFPWENDPTIPGLIHSTIAIIAPLLLLPPMIVTMRQSRPRLTRSALPRCHLAVIIYAAALLGSGFSLATGLLLDGPPPWIGLGERALALAAVAWLACIAYPPRSRANDQRASRFA